MSCSVIAGAIMAYVTCPSVQVAKLIAHQAVKQRLAACGNVIPGVTSIYEWKGKTNIITATGYADYTLQLTLQLP